MRAWEHAQKNSYAHSRSYVILEFDQKSISSRKGWRLSPNILDITFQIYAL